MDFLPLTDDLTHANALARSAESETILLTLTVGEAPLAQAGPALPSSSTPPFVGLLQRLIERVKQL